MKRTLLPPRRLRPAHRGTGAVCGLRFRPVIHAVPSLKFHLNPCLCFAAGPAPTPVTHPAPGVSFPPVHPRTGAGSARVPRWLPPWAEAAGRTTDRISNRAASRAWWRVKIRHMAASILARCRWRRTTLSSSTSRASHAAASKYAAPRRATSPDAFARSTMPQEQPSLRRTPLYRTTPDRRQFLNHSSASAPSAPTTFRARS